jgi:hypothetical protein
MNYLTKVVQYVILQLEELVYIARTKSVRHGQLQELPEGYLVLPVEEVGWTDGQIRWTPSGPQLRPVA